MLGEDKAVDRAHSSAVQLSYVHSIVRQRPWEGPHKQEAHDLLQILEATGFSASFSRTPQPNVAWHMGGRKTFPESEKCFPRDVIAAILVLLDYRGIVCARCVCRQWNQVVGDDSFWKIAFESKFGVVLRKSACSLSYRERFRLEWNVRHGRSSFKTLKGHKKLVVGVKSKGSRVVSAALDGSVRIWDAKSGECKHIFQGITPSISLAIDMDVIMAWGVVGELHMWDSQSGELLNNFLGSLGNGVLCIALERFELVSGSDDGVIIVWDVRTGEPVHELCGHDDSITCIDVNMDKILTGSVDKTVKVWDRETLTCRTTFNNFDIGIIHCLKHNNGMLVGGFRDGNVRVWDLGKCKCVTTIFTNEFMVLSIDFDDTKVVSGARKVIKVWDIKTGENIRQVRCSNVVPAVLFDGRRILYGDHGDIKVWEFSS